MLYSYVASFSKGPKEMSRSYCRFQHLPIVHLKKCLFLHYFFYFCSYEKFDSIADDDFPKCFCLDYFGPKYIISIRNLYGF